MSTPERASDILKEVASSDQCPLCRQTLHRPKVLPCSHAFCYACLEKQLAGEDTDKDEKDGGSGGGAGGGGADDDKSRLVCTVCRASKEVDRDSVSLLLDLPVFVRILEAATRACRNHQRSPVTVYCKDCDFAICPECIVDHEYHIRYILEKVIPTPKQPEETMPPKTEAEIVEENRSLILRSHEDAEYYLHSLKAKVNQVIDEEMKQLHAQKSQDLKKLTVRDAQVKLKLPSVADKTDAVLDLVKSAISYKELAIKLKSNRLPSAKKETVSPRGKTTTAAVAGRNKFKKVVTSIRAIKAVSRPERTEPTKSGWDRVVQRTASTQAKTVPMPESARRRRDVKAQQATAKKDAAEAEAAAAAEAAEAALRTPPEEAPPETEEQRVRRSTLEKMKIRGRFAAAVTRLMEMDAQTFVPLYEGDKPDRGKAEGPLSLDGVFTEVWESKLGIDITDMMWDVRKRGWLVRTGNLAGTQGDLCQVDIEGALVDRVGHGLIRGNGRISYDRKRKSFIATDGRRGLMCMTRTGTLMKEITIEDSECLFGVTYCPCNDLYIITDTDKHCVWFVSCETGEVVNNVGSEGDGDRQFDLPLFVAHSRSASDDTCHVIVTDTNNSCIKVLTPDGKFVRRYGSYGSGERQLRSPYGTYVDPKGRVLVCDHYNRRVVRHWWGEGGEGWDVVLTESQLRGQRPWCVAVSACERYLVVGLEGKEGVVIGYKHE